MYGLYTVYNLYIMLRFANKTINTIFTRSVFTKVETKVENKIGIIYMDSQKDFNALSAEMKSNLVKNIK